MMDKMRIFRLWYYTVSHGTLVIRSPKNENFDSTIDYVFANIQYLNCPEKMTGLVVSEVDAEREIDATQYKKFELCCEEGIFLVTALAVEFYETLLDPKEYLPEINSTLQKCKRSWPELEFPATMIDIVVIGGIHIEADASHFAYRQAAILAETKNGIRVKLLFVRNRNKKREWLVVLSTD